MRDTAGLAFPAPAPRSGETFVASCLGIILCLFLVFLSAASYSAWPLLGVLAVPPLMRAVARRFGASPELIPAGYTMRELTMQVLGRNPTEFATAGGGVYPASVWERLVEIIVENSWEGNRNRITPEARFSKHLGMG